MASPAYKLTVTDQVFVNALTILLLPVQHDVARFTVWRDVALEARPGVNRDHSFCGPLVQAFDDWDRAEDRMMRERARLRLVELLVSFFNWRGALALDALKKDQAA